MTARACAGVVVMLGLAVSVMCRCGWAAKMRAQYLLALRLAQSGQSHRPHVMGTMMARCVDGEKPTIAPWQQIGVGLVGGVCIVEVLFVRLARWPGEFEVRVVWVVLEFCACGSGERVAEAPV